MSGRGKILGRLRRWALDSGRSVLGAAAFAYVAAGVAPCAAAANPATTGAEVAHVQAARVHERPAGAHEHGAHERHTAHESPTTGGASHHGHGGGSDEGAASPDSGGRHCPHCPVPADGGAGIVHNDGHSSCSTLEDVAHGVAPQAKDVVQTAAPLLSLAAFGLPPPFASPRAAPASPRAMPSPSVPLNVRHCVYLI